MNKNNSCSIAFEYSCNIYLLLIHIDVTPDISMYARSTNAIKIELKSFEFKSRMSL